MGRRGSIGRRLARRTDQHTAQPALSARYAPSRLVELSPGEAVTQVAHLRHLDRRNGGDAGG